MDIDKPDNAGTSRRGLLKCMAWAGTGIVWTVAGGVPRGPRLGGDPLRRRVGAVPLVPAQRRRGLGGEAVGAPRDGFTFVQTSDSHIGSTIAPTPAPNATLQAALDRI